MVGAHGKHFNPRFSCENCGEEVVSIEEKGSHARVPVANNV